MPIVINARCDVIFLRHGEEATRFDESVARCKAYLAAELRDTGSLDALAAAITHPDAQKLLTNKG